jgi:uncharacterized protein (DUF58 family)
LFQRLRPRIDDWLLRPRTPEGGPVALTQQRILILPTRYGIGFALVLVVMLMGSVNYALSLGFVLTFLLGSMAMVSIVHAYRNIADLQVSIARAEPVFAGEIARFPVHLHNRSLHARFSIGLARAGEEQDFADIDPGGDADLSLQVSAPQRGVLAAGRFTLFTRYPIGLFYAWATVELEAACLVYPRPEHAAMPPLAARSEIGETAATSAGDEDFAGLKVYRPGDSPRRIAWKAAARGRTLLTKQFAGQATEEVWLDWTDPPEHLGVEARLSRLAGWVLQADSGHLLYGMRLPGSLFSPASGEPHRQRCLEALARFKVVSAEP